MMSIVSENNNFDIDELKQIFRFDLIGHWVSCQGTFEAIMSEEWIFCPDGSGSVRRRSVMMQEDRESIKWRKKGEFSIEIYEDDIGWKTVNYDFCRVPSDGGFMTALIELDIEKKQRNGFGISNVPLSYLGTPNRQNNHSVSG